MFFQYKCRCILRACKFRQENLKFWLDLCKNHNICISRILRVHVFFLWGPCIYWPHNLYMASPPTASLYHRCGTEKLKNWVRGILPLISYALSIYLDLTPNDFYLNKISFTMYSERKLQVVLISVLRADSILLSPFHKECRAHISISGSNFD